MVLMVLMVLMVKGVDVMLYGQDYEDYLNEDAKWQRDKEREELQQIADDNWVDKELGK